MSDRRQGPTNGGMPELRSTRRGAQSHRIAPGIDRHRYRRAERLRWDRHGPTRKRPRQAKNKHCLQIVHLGATTGNTRASVIAADDVEVRSCGGPFLRVTKKTDDSCLQALLAHAQDAGHTDEQSLPLSLVSPHSLSTLCAAAPKTGPAEPLSDTTSGGGPSESLPPSERPQPTSAAPGTA